MILQKKDCTSKKQSKRQKRMSVNKEKTCPLCLETLDIDDLSFYPCRNVDTRCVASAGIGFAQMKMAYVQLVASKLDFTLYVQYC
ncbi:hypothetical protein TNCV_2674561 [Trichonephila clavipes]|nr:hypothetical protein TNCV_2674561 [Trichonephila clavipes]